MFLHKPKYRVTITKNGKLFFKRTNLSFETMNALLALADKCFRRYNAFFEEINIWDPDLIAKYLAHDYFTLFTGIEVTDLTQSFREIEEIKDKRKKKRVSKK